MSLEGKIWIPKSAKPAFVCRICGDEFHAEESITYERHVAKCARDNHDGLVEQYQAARPDAFFKPFDEEYAAWVKKHQRVG